MRISRIIFGFFSPLLRCLVSGLEHIDLITLFLPNFTKVTWQNTSSRKYVEGLLTDNKKVMTTNILKNSFPSMMQSSVDRLILSLLGRNQDDLTSEEVRPTFRSCIQFFSIMYNIIPGSTCNSPWGRFGCGSEKIWILGNQRFQKWSKWRRRRKKWRKIPVGCP